MHEKNSRPTVLCFAGLDPSGGAGLQADIETIASHSSHALPIATCLTVQNTLQSSAVYPVDTKVIEEQFKALIEDATISSCKIGVIPNKEIAECIAELIQHLPSTPVVYDPVIRASHGSQFTDHDTLEIIKSKLLPHVTVLTPNVYEACTLLSEELSDISMATKLCDYGVKYILTTGADCNTDSVMNTLLSKEGLLERYSYERLPQNYHGSGCTLSSAIASNLAIDSDIKNAVLLAQDFTHRCLQNAHAIGRGQQIPTRVKQLTGK